MRVAHRTNDPGQFAAAMAQQVDAYALQRVLLAPLAAVACDDGLLGVAHVAVRRAREGDGTDLDWVLARMAADLWLREHVARPTAAAKRRGMWAAIQVLAGSGADPAFGADRVHALWHTPAWARREAPACRIGLFLFYWLGAASRPTLRRRALA